MFKYIYPGLQGGVRNSQSQASFMNFQTHRFNIQTGIYNKIHVRIKEIPSFGKKDITNDVMKELKMLREINHQNINLFIGAHVKSNNTLVLLTEFCSRGSLQDILADKEEIQLDVIWLTSLMSDLVQGMYFLHYSTPLGCHGNLRSSNCVVTSR